MERTGPAEGQQGEAAGVVAPLDADHADGVGHVLVGDLHHGMGQLLHRHAQRCGHGLCRRPGRGLVELHPAAEEVLGVQAAQHQVGVGEREVLPARPVADGAGIGPGAVGADLEEPAGVDPGDRPPARADGSDVDQRHGRGYAPLDLVGGGVAGPAVKDQTHIGAGAAHVQGHQVVEAHQIGDALGRHRPPGRARHHQMDGMASRGRGVHEPAVRLHHGPVDVDARLPQPGLETAHVALHERLHISVGDGGARPLVLAPDGGHLMGHRQRQAAEAAAQLGGEALLVGRVQVREEQTDGDGLGLDLGDPVAQLVNGFGFKPDQHLAAGVHPLPHPQAVAAALKQGPGLVPGQVVEVLAVDPLDVGDVLVPGRTHEGHPGPGPLDQGVGGHGGAVDQEVDLFGRGVRLSDRGDERLGGRFGRGGHLQGRDRAGVGVEADQVGEGSAGVDADALGCHQLSRFALCTLDRII